MGVRQFIHEGPLQKNKSKRKLRGYLFNDFLLIVQPKFGAKPFSLYRKVFPSNLALPFRVIAS